MNEKHQGDIRDKGGAKEHPQNVEAVRRPMLVAARLDFWLANGTPTWFRYGAAILAVTVALVLDRADFLSGSFRIYLVFYPFIILATLFGGVGPGLLAITLSCFAVAFFWAEPVGQFAMAARADRISMALFIIGTLFFIWVCELLRRAIRQAAQAEVQHQSRNMLAQILNSVPQSVFWKDRHSVYLGCNEVFARAVGLAGPEAIIGKTDFDLPWPRQEAEAYTADDRDVMENNRPKRHIIEPLQQADGNRLWIDTTKVPLTDCEGLVFGLLGVYEDITERKRVEEALQESQEQLRLLVAQAPITVAMFDRNMNYLATSRRWIAEYGRGHDDLTGLNHYDIKYDMPDYWREVHRKALAGEAQDCEEDRWVKADGTVSWLRWAVHPWRDAHQQIGGIIISAEDITKRKEAEEALMQSEAFLRAVCGTTPDPIFAKDRESRLLMANPATLRAFGKPVEEVIGKRDDELYADPETARTVLENDRRVIESGIAEVFEETVETPYGRRVFLSTKAPYFDADGRVIGTIGVARDITKRMQAEETLRKTEARFRATFDNAGVGILEGEKEDRIIAANDRVCEILGYPRAELLGMTINDLTAPEDRELSSRVNAEIHSGIRERIEYEKRYLKRDGSRLWSHVTVSAVRDAAGQWNRSITTVEDISERKQAVEALQRAKEEAEAANRAKDQFLAILSHELRTPLTPALITVSAHETDAALTPEYREDLATVRRNLELEARLIDDLLDLNRLVRGKVELRLQASDLNRILQNVLEICRAEIEAKGLLVHLELTAAKHNINGDAGRLQQVFWNLLKNATKFTPSGGVITIRSFTPRSGGVRVEVADAGIGINPEVIPRLFIAFEQGETETKQHFGGLGLGLAICKALVDLHGGKIWVESGGEGKGATFFVELPTIDDQVPRENSASPTQTAKDWSQKNDGHRLRILLVEDNEDTLRILSRLLERAGYKVTPAQSLGTALAAAKTAREGGAEKFDLVVSDLGLPDGDGRDLMQELHDRDGLPGIAISGYGMEDDIKKSRAAGFAEHLTKPIQFEELQAAISHIGAFSG